MSIAKSIQQIMEQSSWIRKMFEEGIELKKIHGEKNVFDFSIGNPLLEPPKKFTDNLAKLTTSNIKGLHRYMPNPGFPSSRTEIAKHLSKESGLSISMDEIIMTTGAAGGLNGILKSLLNPDDEVIVFSPFFVEYLFYISNHKGKGIIAETDDKFIPEISDLENKITNKTKAIIINSPNNPTGVMYPESTISDIGTLIKKMEKKYNSEIYLISDEPYRKLIYNNEKYPFIFKHHSRSVIVTSHSKDLGLAGERIGYISLSPLDKDRTILFDAIIFSLRTLGHVNATALMQKAVESVQNEIVDIKIYKEKRDFLYDNLTKLGYECVKPDGAFYLFPKTPIADDTKFVSILQQYNILTVPGKGFGKGGYFRISYSVEDWVIEGSIKGFEEAYNTVK